MPFKHACFISYRHGQNHLMKRIIDDLYAALSSELEPRIPCEVPVFKDTARLNPGDYLDKKMAQALCESACLIVVYIPIYLDSEHPYCAREFRAMEQLEKKRFEAITVAADKSRSLIIPIVYRGKNNVPDDLIGDRLVVDFCDFDTTKPKMHKTPRYNNEIKKIADHIYERFTLLSGLPTDPCNNCEEFELPKADSDEVRKLLRDPTQPFPTREGANLRWLLLTSPACWLRRNPNPMDAEYWLWIGI